MARTRTRIVSSEPPEASGRRGRSRGVSSLMGRRTGRGKPTSTNIMGGNIIETVQQDIVIDLLRSPPKQNGFREGDYLHVSDLIYKCVRMVALSYSTKTKLHGDPLFDNTLATFAIGDGLHDFVKSKAATAAPDMLYADWHCPCKKTHHIGTYAEAKLHDECPQCFHKPLTHDEIRIRNDDAMIVGSLDMTFLIEQALYISEIKSIKKEDWETLTRPLGIHILQVMFYYWLAVEAGYSVHKQISVLYVTKAHVRGSPYKEFVIDPEKYLHRIEDHITDARALKVSRNGGVLPFKGCQEITNPDAKKCELASLCFNIG